MFCKKCIFERIEQLHKDKEKTSTIWQCFKFCKIYWFKTTLVGFPCHRFNVNHTSKTYDQAIAGVTNSTIVKTQDFSENYKCLLHEEIMSIHWTQEQATVYPVVVLRKTDDVLCEDHLLVMT